MTRTFWGTDSRENEGRIIIIITGNYDVKRRRENKILVGKCQLYVKAYLLYIEPQGEIHRNKTKPIPPSQNQIVCKPARKASVCKSCFSLLTLAYLCLPLLPLPTFAYIFLYVCNTCAVPYIERYRFGSLQPW